MNFGAILLILAGALCCVAVAAMFAFVTRHIATQETLFTLPSPKPLIANSIAVVTTCLMVSLGLFLYVPPFVDQSYSLFASELHGSIFWVAILVIVSLPLIAGCWAIIDRQGMRTNEKMFAQLTFASGALALFLLFNLFTIVTTYGAKTINIQNFASDKSTYYHGPAPIVGGYKRSGSYSSRVTVAYGGEWACPGNPDKEICEVEISLGPCSDYDQSTRSSYWRYWGGKDHWVNSFSCANGPVNGADDDNQDDDDNNNNNYVSYNDDGFDATEFADWPYQIHIIGDCRDTCLAMVDDSVTHNKLFSVERLKLHMFLNGFGALFFFCLGPVLRSLSQYFKQESKNNQLLETEEKDGALA